MQEKIPFPCIGLTVNCGGYIPGLKKLESLNLSFTGGVMDSGLRTIATITSLTSLNLDSKQITDTGLAALTSKDCFATLKYGNGGVHLLRLFGFWYREEMIIY
jgi:hypothetical protein